MYANRLDVDLLDDIDPFEVEEQAAHLFKHPNLGIEDVLDVWQTHCSIQPRPRRIG